MTQNKNEYIPRCNSPGCDTVVRGVQGLCPSCEVAKLRADFGMAPLAPDREPQKAKIPHDERRFFIGV